MHVRRKLVAGNWKMNGSRAALSELGPIAAAAKSAAGVDVAVCPPFTLVPLAVPRAGGILIGAQDCHSQDQGAFTGNVSAPMLVEAGAKLVIVGHSERRAQGEKDDLVKAKAEAALRHGLTVIVCVGESELDREAGRHFDVVAAQLVASLPEEVRSGELVIAYEPIWAIGTGKTATPDDVEAMHKRIRYSLVEGFAGPGVGGNHIRILYGGSVNAANAGELFAVDNVDGALVGGASLTAAQFVPIVEAAARS